MDSIEFYNKNAAKYFLETVNLDMSQFLDGFIELLPEGASVLDLGCGSGRDSARFIDEGFDVTSLDGSREMCNLASIHIGQDVLCLTFDEMDFEEVFDGIWASASLLHVPSKDIEKILAKVVKSLKPNGFLYMSFPYGNFEGLRHGRYYKEYRTRELKNLVNRLEQLEIIELKKSNDLRTDRKTIWISAIVQKREGK
ncbi:MAG TPA: class I SAM-dependent methyltransferase [Clostridiales bacterium]|nr:class I SAM-dependent methyltransferase [Clostridiales bacterium]